jgi:hypothetical protein
MSANSFVVTLMYFRITDRFGGGGMQKIDFFFFKAKFFTCTGSVLQIPTNLSIPTNKKKKCKKVRPPGVEPGSPAWQASIMPLDHERSIW